MALRALRSELSELPDRGTRSIGRFPRLIAFASGAVSAFAFQPVGLWPLILLAFAVLCELLARTETLRRSLLIGWLFGLGQFVIGLNWIATAFTYQAAMPAWLGWIAVVLLSLYLAVYPMLAAALAWTFGRSRPIALVLTLAGAWAITEWLRAGIFTGFAWNPVGVTLDNTHLLNASTVIGTYGLSAVVVLGGGMLWLLFRRDWRPAGILLVAIIALHFVPRPAEANVPSVNVRIIQPNIGQQDKWRPGFAQIASQRLAQLSMKPGNDKRHLLLWPEAAVTDPLEDGRNPPYSQFAVMERQLAAAVIRPGEYLLTGAIGLTSADGRRVNGATNSVYVLGQGGMIVDRYDKAHLVPYGEYLPMRPLLEPLGLARLAPGDVDFQPGPGPRTATIPGWGKVGFQLCYEIIFSGHVVDEKDRPRFIFNPSNDAWFGSWGPPQHLAQARLRAAEEGIPIVRSTPTGISAVIDAHGQVLKSLPWRQPGVIDAELPPPAAALTLFARYGNVIPILIGFALIIGGIVLGRGRGYRTGI